MKLNFYGNGSAFNPGNGNNGAYFTCGDTLYLIDCGSMAFSFLAREVGLDRFTQVYALITHLHNDHVGSLATLISYYKYKRGVLITVIHPEETIIDLLQLQGIDRDEYYYYRELGDNLVGLTAEPVPVSHVANMKCYGYLLSDAGSRQYYSGDASELPPAVLEAFLAGEIETIYQDTSMHEGTPPNHCYYQVLERLIPPALRGRVYCMHLEENSEAVLRAKGFQIAGSPEVKEDGQFGDVN